MQLKAAILQRCKQIIADNHEDMDSGVEFEQYVSKAGANSAYRDIMDFVNEFRDSDDEDDLEEMPTDESDS